MRWDVERGLKIGFKISASFNTAPVCRDRGLMAARRQGGPGSCPALRGDL